MTFREPAKFEPFFQGDEEEGSAFYTKNLSVKLWQYLEPVKDRLVSAIDQVQFSSTNDRPYTIADLGCREGGTSIPIIQGLIDCIRQKYKSTPDIHIMYEDIADCDFKSLFLMANGLTGADYDSAWSSQEGVYFSAVGRSFYEQCFPRNSVHISFTLLSLMYLSTSPCLLPDALICTLSTDEEKKALFAKQGVSDLETFLLNRCKELVHGGILFVVAVYTATEAQSTDRRIIFQTMQTIWKKFYHEGRITKDEMEEATFYFYFRTLEEFKAPFLDDNSAVQQEGLRLVSFETPVPSSPIKQRLNDCATGDPEIIAARAHEIVMAVQSWARGVFLAALSSRPETDRKEIVDELFRRMEAQVKVDPTRYAPGHQVVHIMMQKCANDLSVIQNKAKRA